MDPIIYQRQSAPVNTASLSFYNTFCSHKKKNKEFFDRKVELEPVINLQEFASGGDKLAFQENSNFISVSEFLKSREKMDFLKKIYNHTK